MPVAQQLSQDAQAKVTAATLLERLDLERLEISNRLAVDPKRRAQLGQFFTPANVAHFMAAMLQVPRPPKELCLLDAGGGSGILTAAAVAAFCARPPSTRPDALHATVWEIDERLDTDLARTFEYCRGVCDAAGVRFTGRLHQENFILAAARLLISGGLFAPQEPPRFHVAILNPPYRKLRSESAERAVMSSVGIETSNLYSAFVWLALELLEDRGEIVAITPRSFMNGSYFRPFRHALASALAFRRVHVYDARDVAFAGDAVLQPAGVRLGNWPASRGPLPGMRSGATKWLRSAFPDRALRPPACSGGGGFSQRGGSARFLASSRFLAHSLGPGATAPGGSAPSRESARACRNWPPGRKTTMPRDGCAGRARAARRWLSTTPACWRRWKGSSTRQRAATRRGPQPWRRPLLITSLAYKVMTHARAPAQTLTRRAVAPRLVAQRRARSSTAT